MLNSAQLSEILPQAFPFLLLDRVEVIQPGHSLTAIKNITANEWPYTTGLERSGHYPETLLIEAAAQAALVLFVQANATTNATSGSKYLGKVVAAFHSEAQVGDRVYLEAKVIKLMGRIGMFSIELNVMDKKIAEIELICGVGGK